MKNILHTIFTLFMFIFSALATACITDSSKSSPNIKEHFWRKRHSKEIYGESYTNACRNEVDRTELLICRNHCFFGGSSFWEHLPCFNKTFEECMSKGFRENSPASKVKFFQQALEHAYDALS